MKKSISILILAIASFSAFQAHSQDILGTVMKKVTGGGGDLDVSAGLKEALNQGISAGADALSKQGGYLNSPYKILLPEEARNVVSKLKMVPGFGNVEADMIKKMNAAAEDAAIKAKPIFLDAITKMNFSDAMNILMGEKNAATTYLKSKTFDQLYAAFSPIVINSLDQVGARKYWAEAAGANNRLPFVKKANPSLDDYVTKEALKGLFSMIEVKEKSIRTDQGARTSDLLKSVFAKQDK